VILVGKPLAALAVVLALRYPAKTAVSVALALAQIGEFSFILVALGRSLGVLPERATQALVAAAIISITLNPLLFRLVDPLSKHLSRWLSRSATSEAPPPPHAGPRAIVIGYGPVGRTLARLLREQGLSPTVVELNHDTVTELTGSGVHCIYGDASQREILESAGAREAFALVFAASGSSDAVIREAKEINPRLLILSRASYVREIAALKRAGANMVVSSEGEVAFAMAERLLQQLGATGEQLDRARDRIRAELPAG
jgi:CPA2 family monovalent cation:H+ antiporter-2